MPILRITRPPQGRLLRRHYEPYLTHVPLTYLALRATDHDIAHAVYPADALAGARWRARTGRPAILSYMGIPDRAGLRYRRKRREVLLGALRGCNAVVALSEHAAEAFRYWLGYEPRVIAPGVDLRAFVPAAARSAQPTIVCSAAVEEPRKRIGLLVEAFKLVRRELHDARLVLSRPRSLHAARRSGIDVGAPGLMWADLDSRGALVRAYGEAWVAALPAPAEAFGLVLLEAMACGTPVVGYDDGAIPELVDRPGIGRLFDRLDAGSLAEALLNTMETSQNASTVKRCRARAEDFSVDRCVESYLDLYSELGA